MNHNKFYPAELEEVVLKSLSYYPELEKTEIHFKYVPRIKTSVMQAQPILNSIFKAAGKRSYVIRISRSFIVEGKEFKINQLPSDVLVGWLGHELGHVMDYLNRSLPSMAGFGLGYVFSDNFMKGAERTADEFAVNHGMGEYIQATRNFILTHADFSQKYKDKIRKLYLSPKEIVEIVQQHKMPGSI